MACIKTLYERMGLKQLAMLLMVSIVLISCDSPPSQDLMCVASDDLGNKISKNSQLSSANADWVDSRIEVQQGKKLTIQTQGSIYLCMGSPPLLESKKFIPSATNRNWQNSGIAIQKGYKYIFEVTGGYTLWGGGMPTGCGGRYFDSDCWLRKGKGLFAFIGSTPSFTWVASDSENQDGTDSFFEMYRRDAAASTVVGTSSTGAGYGVDNMQQEGTLWFRYRDHTDEIAANSWGADWYSDNRGAYEVTVKRYPVGACYGDKGKFMQAKIADSATATGTPINRINSNECSVESTVVSGDQSADICGNGVYSTISAPATGKVWLRILDSIPTGGDGNYTAYTSPSVGSNSGSYSVGVTTVKADDDKFSSLVNAVVDPIRTILLGNKSSVPPKIGLTETMYKGISRNGEFVQGVRALMALSIVFFAFSYMAGLSNITHKEFINFIIKISIVITAISPSSWDFFSRYLFAFFIEGTDSLIYIMSNNINNLVSGSNAALMSVSATNTGAGQGSSVFGFLNSTLAILFSAEANIKLQALFATFPLGVVLAMIMYIGIFYFLFALFKALLAYLISIIMTALLIFLAPIFICFILFNLTKPIFNRWLKQLVGFALQPVLLFMVLAIFNVFIVMSLYSVLNFSACYTCLWEMDLPLSEILDKALPAADISDFDKFCVAHGYLPWGMDASQDTSTKLAKTPAGLFYVLMFVIFANMMLQFIDWVVNIANTLTGADQAQANSASAVSTAIGQATGMAKSAATMGIDTARFAGRNIAAGADKATGHALSDGAKKVARRALPRFLTKGGKDITGQHVAVKAGFMTRDERAGYQNSLDEFRNLNKDQQQVVRDRNRDRRDDEKISGLTKSATQNLRAAQMKDFAMLGKGSDSMFSSAAARKQKENAQKRARDMYDRGDIDKYARASKGGSGVGSERKSILARSAIRDDLSKKTGEFREAQTPQALREQVRDEKALAENRKMMAAEEIKRTGGKKGFDRFKSNEAILNGREEARLAQLAKKAAGMRVVTDSKGREFVTENGQVTEVRTKDAPTMSAREGLLNTSAAPVNMAQNSSAPLGMSETKDKPVGNDEMVVRSNVVNKNPDITSVEDASSSLRVMPMEMKAAYEVLGVTPDATEREVRVAYQKLARTHHPDKGGDKDTFSQISNAYMVITQPDTNEE